MTRLTVTFLTMSLALAGALIGDRMPARAMALRAITISGSRDGLALVMRLPRRLYPRGAVVPVSLTLHNVSSGVRVLWLWDCHNPPYGVQVLDRSGRVVYPAATRGKGTLPCAGNMAPGIFAGMSATYHLKIVLLGPFVRARIPFGVAASSGDTHELLSTRTVRMGNF